MMENPGGSALTILLIDDDPNIVEAMSIFFKGEGYDVHGALSGEEGIVLARKVSPDIIVLDIEMPPGIGGPEVCRKLRDEPATSEIPIIFLTAKVDLDAMEETYEGDAQGYLLKPFSPHDLLGMIREVLELDD